MGTPLEDDFLFASGQNIKGVIAKLTSAVDNIQAATTMAARGQAGQGRPITLGFTDLNVYSSGFPDVATQLSVNLTVNPSAQSGRWFEFSDSLTKAMGRTVRLPEVMNKYLNLRYEKVLGRSQVNGEWIDTNTEVWQVAAVADTPDGAARPDDATWTQDDPMARLVGNAAGQQALAQAQAGMPSGAPTQAGVDAATGASSGPANPPAEPEIPRDELIIQLADGKLDAEFQQAAFQNPQAGATGLSDDVLNQGSGILSPFLASGQLVLGDDGRYRRG